MRRALLVLTLALLAACGKRPEPASDAPPPATAAAGPALQVLATSDLKDIEPLAGQIKAATGVDVQFRFGGTMESTQEVLSGDSAGKHAPDVAWFANAKYLLSDTAGQRKVKLQEKIMLSPMAVGVSRSDAEKNGWTKPDARLTWADITRAAKAGKLQYALSNPATSHLHPAFATGGGGVVSCSEKDLFCGSPGFLRQFDGNRYLVVGAFWNPFPFVLKTFPILRAPECEKYAS